ncbi:monooxygenase [Microvirga aerophila]|uniref:Monooxygenase n=2 Tax=Microvirga aerophila TaxID=670291 RepID=A0A512C0Z0_9HYPH|nr:monooxygenase [Microvirga aerophila]
MITAIVRFPLPHGLSPEEVKSAYEHSAPQFRGAPGLIRKYYLHGADRTGGGVYLWESREAAERVYSDAWRQRIADRFGAQPEIEYFDTPLVIDNSEISA